jgi:flagellar hook-length control protein FliK
MVVSALNFGTWLATSTAMSATQSISRTLPSNESVQPNGSSAASQTNRGNSQDFAGALNDAGAAKPTRRNTTRNAHADSSGGQLPPSGNQPPPAGQAPAPQGSSGGNARAAPAAAPVTTSAAAAGATSSGAGSSGTQADAPGGSPPVANAPAQDPSAPVTAAQAALIAAASAANPDAPGPAADGGMTMPHATAMAPPLSGTASPGATASPAGTASPATVAAPTIPAGIKTSASGRVAAAASSARDAKPDANADEAAPTAATSAPTSTADSAGSDPTAQAVMAAAGAQASVTSTSDNSSPYDATVPDPSAAMQGVQGSNASPATDVASTAMHAAASTAAAVTAATAASIAQVASAAASAGAGAADKRSRDKGPDATVSGASTDGTAGAAQLLSFSSSTSSTDTPTPTFKLPAGVDTGEFGQGVADRVSMMMDGNLTSAKLQVNPPALGPIEVRIALQSGHAQVWFTSHSAVTRDALESSAPKLREMLGAQGFGQVSVDISQRSFQDRSPPSKGYEAMPATGGATIASVESPSAHSRIANGLLDAYA